MGTCTPILRNGWGPKWTPPKKPIPDACTSAQIERAYSICWGKEYDVTRRNRRRRGRVARRMLGIEARGRPLAARLEVIARSTGSAGDPHR